LLSFASNPKDEADSTTSALGVVMGLTGVEFECDIVEEERNGFIVKNCVMDLRSFFGLGARSVLATRRFGLSIMSSEEWFWSVDASDAPWLWSDFGASWTWSVDFGIISWPCSVDFDVTPPKLDLFWCLVKLSV